MLIDECVYEKNCSGCISKSLRGKVFDAARHYLASKGYSVLELVESISTGWRTRAKLAVRRQDGRLQIGLFKANSHEVYCIPQCAMHHESINKVVEELLTFPAELGYDESSHSGDLRYIQVTVERQTGCAQVCLVVNCHPTDEESCRRWRRIAVELHGKNRHLFSSIYLNYQPEATNCIFGQRFEFAAGDSYIYESIVGIRIPIAPSHFVQAHPNMFERLLADLKSRVNKDEFLIELYAGMGVISLILAPFCKKVLAIEKDEGAEESFLSAVGFLLPDEQQKLQFMVGDVEELSDIPVGYTSILVDPPRKGLKRELVASIIRAPGINKIYYISCHFPSLQRDIDQFLENEFFVDFARAYRFFPGTNHIETLVVLKRNTCCSVGESY